MFGTFRRHWRTVARNIAVVFSPAVSAPLTDIAVDLVQPPSVWLERIHRNSLLAKDIPFFDFLPVGSFGLAVSMVAVVVRFVRGNRCAPPKWCLGSGPRHIFPF